MKKFFYSCLFSLSFFSPTFAQNEIEAIKEVILEAYVNGAYNDGIPRNMELGFSENYEAIGLTEAGTDSILTINEWIAEVKRKKAAGEFPLPDRGRASVRYEKLDISGSLANVKLTLLFGNKPAEINYLDLYHYPTGWMIVNKTYQEYPGRANAEGR